MFKEGSNKDEKAIFLRTSLPLRFHYAQREKLTFGECLEIDIHRREEKHIQKKTRPQRNKKMHEKGKEN